MPSHEKNETLISSLNLRKTRVRKGIANLFANNPATAFSENEILHHLDLNCDRTSVYRTIKTLLKKAFIHKILCENGATKYALSEDNSGHSTHVHFQCNQCQKVFCLTNSRIEIPKLPQNFQAESCYFLVQGNCLQCCSPKLVIA